MVFFKKWLLTLVILLSYSYPSLVFAQTEDSLKVGSSSQKILFAEQDTFSKISCVRDGSGIGRISFGKKFEKLNNPKDFILKIKSSSKNKETNTSKKIAFAKRCLKPLKTFSKIVKQAKKNNKKSQFKISPLLSVSAPVLTAVLPDPMTFENPNSSGLFPVKFTGENFQAPFSGDIQTPFSILLVESAGNVFPYPFKLNNSSEIEVETIAVSDAVVKVMVVTVIGKTTLFSNPLSVVLTGDNSQPDLDFAKPSILGISADPVIANSSSNYEFSLDVLNAYPSSSLTTAFSQVCLYILGTIYFHCHLLTSHPTAFLSQYLR